MKETQLKQQIAHYLEQQPESTQALHRWMKRFEVAGLGIIAAAFILALYLSFAWKSINPIMIPVAWFLFAASPAPAIVLVGLHAVILRAFPPVVLPGRQYNFVTGSAALWPAWGFVLLGLAVGAFWGFFAYTVGTFNLAMLEPMIGVLGAVMGVVITLTILLTMLQKTFKTR